jgi:hypothetical protein
VAQNRRLIGFLHEVLEVKSLDAPVGINPCVDPYCCDHCLGKSEPATEIQSTGLMMSSRLLRRIATTYLFASLLCGASNDASAQELKAPTLFLISPPAVSHTSTTPTPKLATSIVSQGRFQSRNSVLFGSTGRRHPPPSLWRPWVKTAKSVCHIQSRLTSCSKKKSK